jgi:hypothetical protein
MDSKSVDLSVYSKVLMKETMMDKKKADSTVVESDTQWVGLSAEPTVCRAV